MIQDVIAGQKAELERKLKESYLSRETILKGFETDLINVVIGPRRSGKSFFSMHTTRSGRGVGYVNFDEERLLKVDNFDEIISAVKAVYADPHILFFDEIQNVDQWEIIANRLYREGFKLILTGSNSHLLSSDLATHLTGRHYATALFPFSFREVLSLFPQSVTAIERQQRCLDYVMKGGFPELWVKNYDPSDYLSTLFDSIILKDIVKRYKVRFPNALIDLAQIMITNITGEFSTTSIQKLANFNSIHTVEKYISYLEEAFLVFSVPRFSYKITTQKSAGKKIYCYDTGYYQAKAFSFSKNIGKLFENAVAIELKKQEMAGNIRLFYYKSQKQEEVDFVVQENRQIAKLIQVCYAVSEPKVMDREIRSLLKASAELKCDRLLVITNNLERTEKHSWFGFTGEIEFIPLWKWFLTSQTL